VSLFTKCVTGDFLQLTFNDVGREGRGGEGGRVGQKVLSKPSADSFAVGRRQKPTSILISCLPGHHDCKKVARQIKTGYCFKKSLLKESLFEETQVIDAKLCENDEIGV
jgi:hypothetical protein